MIKLAIIYVTIGIVLFFWSIYYDISKANNKKLTLNIFINGTLIGSGWWIFFIIGVMIIIFSVIKTGSHEAMGTMLEKKQSETDND